MNKVLIADDNTQITKVLKDYASKEGWGCYVAYNGEEALRLFREFSREITIVFLDVMMPRKDGFAVCKAIRAMSQVPVIMITGSREDAAISARERGFLTLRKPLQRSELARAFLELGFAAED